MLTAVQWFPEKGRRSGKDRFGIEYEQGGQLTALRISPGKRYRMRAGDWIVYGGKLLRRVTKVEMQASYTQKVVNGKTVITLRKDHVHPWAIKSAKPGVLAGLLGLSR
jgi:hypothetical protein